MLWTISPSLVSVFTAEINFLSLIPDEFLEESWPLEDNYPDFCFGGDLLFLSGGEFVFLKGGDF